MYPIKWTYEKGSESLKIDRGERYRKANVRLRSMLSSEIKWLGADGEGCP